MNRWTAFKEPTVIKLLDVQAIKPHQLELTFSDHTHGIFDGARYLSTRQGPLLEPCAILPTLTAASWTRAPCAGPTDWNYLPRACMS